MTADTIGGVWTYTLDLVRELTQLGVEPILVTAGRPLNREQRSVLRGIPGLTTYESAYRLEWMEDAWDDVDAMGRWLLQIAGEVNPDLVHLNQYSHAKIAWNKPVLVVSHSDIFSWFHWVKGEKPGTRWHRYHDEVKSALQAADLVVAPTDAALQDLLREYGALPSLKLIPNGRSRDGFREMAKENFILTVGRIWDEGKNISALEEAAEALPVFAAGSCLDPSNGTVKRLPKSMKYLDELPPSTLSQYLGRAGIFALPAKYEPFGLSILEAAMHGCALVLGDIPSLKENWSNAAVFVDPNDSGAIRETLHSLLQDPDRRAELGRLAREKSAAFESKSMGKAYAETYRLISARRLACAS